MLFDAEHYHRLLPELEEFVSERDRQEAFERAVYATLRSGSYYVMAVLVFGPITLAVLLGLVVAVLPPSLGLVGSVLAVTVAVLIVPAWLFKRRVGHNLRGYVRAVRVPTCHTCGYNLTGLTEPRCPECGQPFDTKLLSATDVSAAGDTAGDSH